MRGASFTPCCSVPARRRLADTLCKHVWRWVMWKVCVHQQRGETCMWQGCVAKEWNESGLWKESPPSPNRSFSQMLPRSFFIQFLPRSGYRWQLSLGEVNLHARKMCAPFRASFMMQEPSSGSLTFTWLLLDVSFQAFLYLAHECL